MYRGLPRDTGQRIRGGEGPEDFASGEYYETQEGEYGEHNTWTRSGLMRNSVFVEAIVWKHVSCPYILKFNGLFYHNDIPAIVTPWMPHGNITEYLQKHHGTDRLRLVSSDVPPAPSINSLYTFPLSSL